MALAIDGGELVKTARCRRNTLSAQKLRQSGRRNLVKRVTPGKADDFLVDGRTVFHLMLGIFLKTGRILIKITKRFQQFERRIPECGKEVPFQDSSLDVATGNAQARQ